MNRIVNHAANVSLAAQIILSIIIVWNGGNIPTHWNAYGEIDSYGNSSNVIILTLLNVLSAVFLHWLSNHPEVCNFPRPFKNRETAFRRMSDFVRLIRFEVSAIFLYITVAMIYRELWIGILYI